MSKRERVIERERERVREREHERESESGIYLETMSLDRKLCLPTPIVIICITLVGL